MKTLIRRVPPILRSLLFIAPFIICLILLVACDNGTPEVLCDGGGQTTICVRVFDSNANLVSGASVTAESSSNSYNATTNSSGLATMSGVEPGTYTVFANKAGVGDGQAAVTVGEGDSQLVDVDLFTGQPTPAPMMDESG